MANKRPVKLLKGSSLGLQGERLAISRLDFRFEKKLREGPLDKVWRVKYQPTGEFLTLKLIPKHALPSFHRDIQLWASLDHPHVSKVLSHFEDNKFYYLVLQSIEGESLQKRLQIYKQLTELEVAQLFNEIIQALLYLQSQAPQLISTVSADTIFIDKHSGVVLDLLNGQTAPIDFQALGSLLYKMLVGHSPTNSPHNLVTYSKPKLTGNISSLAKELIFLTFKKGSTLEEIQDHVWLRSTPSMRRQVVIYDEDSKDEEETKSTIYTRKSSKDSDLTFELSESDTSFLGLSFIGDNSFRRSIECLSESISVEKEAVEALKSYREEVRASKRHEHTLLKDLESKIKARERERETLNSKIKDLKDKLETLTVADLEHGDVDYSAQAFEMNREFRDKRTKIEILKKQARVKREAYEIASKNLIEKEAMLSKAKGNLRSVKLEHRENMNKFFVKTNELKLEKETLEVKIQRSPKNLGQSQVDINQCANEIKTHMDRMNYKNTEKVGLNHIYEKISEKEIKIYELKIQFEENKKKIIREKEREISERSKESIEENLNIEEENLLLEEELAAEYKRYNSLRNQREQLYEFINSLRNSHSYARRSLRSLKEEEVKFIMDMKMLEREGS